MIGWIWGDFTPLLAALIVCMVLDYISGVACAVVRKDVSSEVGFKGIVKKILILMLVGVAHVLDAYVLNSTPVLQSAVTMFLLLTRVYRLWKMRRGSVYRYQRKCLKY